MLNYTLAVAAYINVLMFRVGNSAQSPTGHWRCKQVDGNNGHLMASVSGDVGGRNRGDNQLTSCVLDVEEYTSGHVLSDTQLCDRPRISFLLYRDVNSHVIRALQPAHQ